jgi:hypothetical protein
VSGYAGRDTVGATWGKRAKRTQFSLAGRNRWGKPGPQTRFIGFGSPIHPTPAQLRQTNPIRPSGQAWSLERQTVRNKPNSCHYADQEIGVPRRADCAKQSQFGGSSRGWSLWCETKPIPRLRISDWGLGTDLRRDARCGPPGQGPVVQTKPIARRGAPRRCPAEQQKGQVLCGKGFMVNSTSDRPRQNKANLGKPGWDPGSRLCRTKPISGAGSRGAGANRAKQTQFGPAGRLGPWRGKLCETNPIPAAMPIRRSAFPGGPIVRNKANSQRGCEDAAVGHSRVDYAEQSQLRPGTP